MRKTRLSLTFAVIVFFAFLGFTNAQTAKLQIIHNSADALVDEVDIFVNGDSFLTDVGFRQATNFMDVPAGVDLNIIVAPAGAGIDNGVGPITVNLTADETYIAIASGIVSATGYDPATPFSLEVFTPAREEAQNSTEVDVLVFHGATDAPEVSVWVQGGDEALFTFEYSDFSGYLSLPEADYVLEIRTADGETVVASYVAPLETLELEGAALTVLASGFLNPTNNSDGPAFGLFVATAGGGDLIALPVYEPEPETARAQIIHNAADLAAANVDVFVNGEIFVPDFAFRTATPFVDVPAGVELTIDVAPAGAGIESSVFDITVEFDADETYVIVANGIVSETGYDPIEPFTVYPFEGAREEGQNENETDLLVFHGSTDAPEVSVWAMGGESALFTFEYGQFAGYLGLPTDDYVIEIRTADGETTVVAYSAPLATLELEGAALTVVASGFLNPANNSDGPAFGLFVATAAGGELLALPVFEEQEPVIVGFPFFEDFETPENYSNWMIIDGSGSGFVWELGDNDKFIVSDPMDGSFASVDSDAAGTGNNVWSILQAPIIDLSDFEGGNIELSFAHHFRRFGNEEAYVKISNDGENWETIATYVSNQGSSTGFSGPFEVTAVAETLIIEGFTSEDSLYIRFEYDDKESWGWYWLIDNISVNVASTTVVDIIVGSEIHTTLAAAVTAAGLVETLQGEGPFTVFAPTDEAFDALPEGLLDDLLDDPSGALTDILLYHVVGAFALSTDLEDGQVITTLLGEDVVVTITNGSVFINDAEVILADLVADNGVVHVIDAVLVPEVEEPTTVVDIILGSEIHTTLAAAVAAADLVETLQGEGPFTVFAPTDEAFDALPEGLLDDLLDDPSGALTDILLYHVVGAFALSTDLEDGQVITTLLGEDVVVTITNGSVFINDAEVIVADLVADNGVVHVIDAVLVPEVEPEPEFARAQIIHNAADMAAANVDVFVNGEMFVPDFAFRTATPFVDVPAGVELTIDIAPAGAGIESSVFDITVEFEADETYIIIANGIVSDMGYDPVEPFTVYPFAGAREMANDANETDVLVFHGATDAPVVSVWETGVGAGELFSFGYGEYAGYLSLGTLDYVLEVRTEDGETTVAAYSAPLQSLELEGAAITVVASGFLNPDNNSSGPAFGLYVAIADGGDLIALPVFTNVELLDPVFGDFNIYPNPVRENLNIMFDMNRAGNVSIEIFNILGSRVFVNELGNRSNVVNETINVSFLPQGTYIMNIRTSDDVITRKINVVK
ncbi:MAG: DUF4397 domain-containing protein [Bacteroidetes bacterium]|nr:MAG: DUF4397 domain-containing protein [Bacteroidota bacterium]